MPEGKSRSAGAVDIGPGNSAYLRVTCHLQCLGESIGAINDRGTLGDVAGHAVGVMTAMESADSPAALTSQSSQATFLIRCSAAV